MSFPTSSPTGRVYERVAAQADLAGLPVTAAAIADIDLWLHEEKAAERRQPTRDCGRITVPTSLQRLGPSA